MSYRYWMQTWILQSLTWVGFSLSFYFVVCSLPGIRSDLGTTMLLMAATASMTLGMVAGFVSLLPGGAGVRELVLTVILAPVVGHASALVAAILARMIFLAVELLLTAVIRVCQRNLA